MAGIEVVPVAELENVVKSEPVALIGVKTVPTPEAVHDALRAPVAGSVGVPVPLAENEPVRAPVLGQ